jgi:1-acyl-sn-glycerol-3-phosphate acyltransferase
MTAVQAIANALRSALFNVVFFGTTVILLIPGTIARLFAPHRVLDVAILWARTLVLCLRIICRIRVEVTGLEHVPRGAALIASRHQSAFDTFVWMTIVPRCCYVLKRELLRIPLFGPLLRSARMIAVNRASGAAAIRTLIRDGAQAVREERQIVIFPEGTRAEPGAMLPLQPGIAALAARTGLPVIPVVTDSGHHWGRRAFRKWPGTIHIAIRPPIPAGLKREVLMARLARELAAPLEASEPAVDNSVGNADSRFSVYHKQN